MHPYIPNAKVFPDPVVASTQTSLFVKNKGIVAACTGVICVNPKAAIASNDLAVSLGSICEKSTFDMIR
jgi:hypothetical protein